MPLGQWTGSEGQNPQEQPPASPIQPMATMVAPPQGGNMAPITPGVLGQAPQAVTSPLQQITQFIIKHEGLEPNQTPIRITNPKMSKWTSIYDDTIKIQLDPNAAKGKGRQNFLYLKNQEDLVPLITEQFRRYSEKPAKYGLPENPTLEQAIRVFDQTGADNKISYIQKMGIDPNTPLKNLYRMPRQAQPMGVTQ
jgi:hypothetical protein